jgi:hypothetical protein
MRQFKSDGRYKYHSLGFHYIVEFGWVNREDRVLFVDLMHQFEDMYGKHIHQEINADGWPVKTFNEHYRLEQSNKARRRRIYLREESALTLALLRISK